MPNIVAEPDTAGHWRQMLRPDVLGSAFAISLYLLFYLSAVGQLVVYFATAFGYSEQHTNSLANWYWGANAAALVVAGVLSDRLRVRKPFMLIGGIASIALTAIFAMRATHPETTPQTFALLFVGIGVFSAMTYAPWMASFTETVEKRDPAATATGLAVWGWTIRIVVAVSTMFLPIVVTAANTLIEHGNQVGTAAAQAGPALRIVQEHPQLFAELSAHPQDKVPPELAARAVREVGEADLRMVQIAQPQLEILRNYGPRVQQAQVEAPGQWQTWWWICVAGQVVFLPFIFLMAGRWSPRRARERRRGPSACRRP